MKIDQSAIALQSQHASASLRSTNTRLRAWVGSQRPDFAEPARLQPSATLAASTSLTLSEAARVRLQGLPAQAAGPAQALHDASAVTALEPRMQVLVSMVAAITGRAVRVFDARQLQAATGVPAAPVNPAGTTAQPPASGQVGWGVEVDTTEFLAELENTRVSAQGVVLTADGQQINFSLQLDMSRAFVQTSSTSLRAGDAVRKDPLVINFNGSAAELTDAQFAFDLDADGQTERIAFVSGGSGFLALDKNADGQINDGTELFGTRSGDGFADLAAFDQDGNQWIDDNDAVYSQLRVWQRDASGQDRLGSLAQSGVGALYLGRVASPFSVNTASNQTLGLVRSTGVFLYASGQVGTLQQVDL